MTQFFHKKCPNFRLGRAIWAEFRPLWAVLLKNVWIHCSPSTRVASFVATGPNIKWTVDFSAEEKWEENIEAEDVPLHLATVDVEGVEDMEAQAVPLHLFT